MRNADLLEQVPGEASDAAAGVAAFASALAPAVC